MACNAVFKNPGALFQANLVTLGRCGVRTAVIFQLSGARGTSAAAANDAACGAARGAYGARLARRPETVCRGNSDAGHAAQSGGEDCAQPAT